MPSRESRPTARRTQRTTARPWGGTIAAWAIAAGTIAALFAPPVAAGSTDDGGTGREAAYQLAIGKMLAAEGDVAGAAEAMAAAVERVPDDPWLRLQYAELLTDLAGGARPVRDGLAAARRAVEQAEAARALRPDEPEVWKTLYRARLAVAQRDESGLPAALAALERSHQLAPDDLQGAVTLGQIYLNMGRSQDAAEVLQSVSLRARGNAYVESLLAEALLAAGRQQEAEDGLARLLVLDPDNRKARLTLAEIQSGRGDHQAALVTLRGAAEPVPRDIRQRVALELHLTGADDEALAMVEQMLAERPEPALHALQALILADEGRHEELAAVLDELAADDPTQLRLADLLEQQGAADEAEQVLRRVLDRLAGEPGSAADTAWAVRKELAGLLQRRGNLPEAVAVVAPGLDAAQPTVRREAVLISTELLSRLGRADEALATLDRLDRTAAAPEVVGPLRVEVLLRAGRDRAAQRLLERLAGGRDEKVAVNALQAAQLEERYELTLPLLERRVAAGGGPQAQFLLGAAYERTGSHARAVETFRRLIAAQPDNSEALNYLGYMWAERGENLDEARTLIERAVSSRPDSGAYVDSLGWVHYQLGDYELALRYLQRAAALEPDSAEIFEHLGDVHRALGDRQRAREFYLRALALAADSDIALRHKLDGLQAD